uniref:Uncharacterized protein n=1 Tax=Hanusia phi TaxID=3032 RepID=A0A7S0EKE9_9CRYP|mmetsp:Transcript_25524/g.57441  ORF Transcript_25524/g.57441 Transcript_25524/m.57441 type:complete len:192 (+) Transcript_25524:2-577(+)|eukprot:118035-Hanusia_phi.AAC.3
MAARLEILLVQEQRAQAFDDMEQAFKALLSSQIAPESLQQGQGDHSKLEAEFIAVCNMVTTKFKALSAQMISIEERLKLTENSDDIKLANMIRNIQDEEREHIRLVIALQVERKRLEMLRQTADKTGKCHQKHNDEHGCECGAKLEEEIEDLKELISIQEDKVKWMKQQNADNESKINEYLDEVRYWEGEC